jgi:dethiobiotin synthetase
MAGYFITGTDTDVGKTVVTSLLLSYLKNTGGNVFPYKPIQSGAILEDGKLQAPDVQMYQRVLPQLHTEKACTYLLKKASSPHLAAREENVTFDIDGILKNTANLEAHHDLVLVEGAGGVVVPIQDDYCMIDLMKDLKLPVILVGRAGLGTINHTVLSVMALKSAYIPIEGIILNATQTRDETIEKDNIEVIEQLTGIPVLGIIPRLENLDEALQNPQHFQSIFQQLNQTKEDIAR